MQSRPLIAHLNKKKKGRRRKIAAKVKTNSSFIPSTIKCEILRFDETSDGWTVKITMLKMVRHLPVESSSSLERVSEWSFYDVMMRRVIYIFSSDSLFRSE